MSNHDIIRAWKDEDYRLSLSAFEQAQLPDNPAGMIELNEEHLANVGGYTGGWCATISITIGTIAISLQICSPAGTLCGSCNWGTAACC